MTSIADIVLNIITQSINGLAGFLPLEYAQLTIATFNSTFNAVGSNLAIAYNSIDFLAPAWLIISVFSIILVAEIVLVVFKGSVMIINIIRGAGA